jgi:hypothetical protein
VGSPAFVVELLREHGGGYGVVNERLPIAFAYAHRVMGAFGFFDTEEEHEAVLREAARGVTIGGRLALKVVNGGFVLDDFRETGREERDYGRQCLVPSRTP